LIRVIFSILSLFLALFAQDNYELKLYEKILPVIFKVQNLNIYVDEDSKSIIKNTKFFYIVSDCTNASLLIGKKFNSLKNECLSKPRFATSYKSFMKQPNVIGAFYWRKSRPQIRFKSENILKYHLFLPDSLRRFAK